MKYPTNQISEVIPQHEWINSAEFAAAHAYVTRHAPDLVAMLGLDGAEVRVVSSR